MTKPVRSLGLAAVALTGCLPTEMCCTVAEASTWEKP